MDAGAVVFLFNLDSVEVGAAADHPVAIHAVAARPIVATLAIPAVAMAADAVGVLV